MSSDPASQHEKLNALTEKLKTAKSKKPLSDAPPPSAMGMATRLGAEFASGVLVGAGAGWLLDDWLDTKPWLLCICLIFGTAAGVKTMMQTLKQYDRTHQDSESSDTN